MNDAAPLRLAMPGAARQRARGEARLRFARAGARTAVANAYETGGLRLRFPRAEAECEAVLVNTGGGMAGGDRATIEIAVGAAAQAFVTTQSAEKIYRCDGEPVTIETRLTVEAGGSLVWAPQETLLFEAAALERRLSVELAADATLLIVEAVVFGRLASGETDVAARLVDRWRVRRADRLVFAEALRLADAAATLDRPAVGAGARAIATILCVAPDAAAEAPKLRAALEAIAAEPGEIVDAGVSGFDGLVVARLVSPSPGRLRAAVIAAMLALRGRGAPRVWS